MSIDAKRIQIFLWRIIRFSGSCCYRFVRRYPVVSGFLIFLFFLYIFFASVFYFLIYSSPVLVCTAVSVRFYLKTKFPEFQWFRRKDSDKRSSAAVNRSHHPPLKHQKSVRRNARKEVVEWDRKHSEERDILFPRSPCDFLEENSKFIFDVKKGSSVELGEIVSDNKTGNDRVLDEPNAPFDNETSRPHSTSGDRCQGQSEKDDKNGGGGCEVEVQSLEEREDEEDEEVQKDVNQTGEWSEDDEKSLADLDLSESERNKRLESLIARRRAKKLFHMAVQKTLMDMNTPLLPSSQIAPIITLKNNLLGVSSDPNEGLQIPGSAPSVLLPTQNPFDLPYDPHEEKPNLMADSFQQEFMAANQKDMLLCRHESFCRGPFLTLETTKDINNALLNPYTTNKKLVEGPGLPISNRLPDKGGHHQHNSPGIGSNIDLVEIQDSNHNEEIKSLEGKKEEFRESGNERIIEGEKMGNAQDLEPGLDSRSEVRMGTGSIENDDSCYSSSSEASDSALDQTLKCPGIRGDQGRKALNLSIPPKWKSVNRPVPYDSSPSPCERPKTDFNLFYSTYRQHGHTPTCSIASDLQVEVSEIGSPPLTNDETVSSLDGGSVTYDGDVDRDVNSDNDELWGGSFNLSRGEANQEKLRELQDIIEEDSAEVEFSGLNRKPEEPIASISPSEQEAMQNLDVTSLLSSRIDINDNDVSHPKSIDHEIDEDVKGIDEGVEGFETFYISDAISPENPGKTKNLMEKLMFHSPSESCFEKSELLIEHHQKPTEEFSFIGNVEPITQEDANTIDSKLSEIRENGAQLLSELVALGDMRKPAEAINLDSSEQRHGNLETSYESKSTMESEKEAEESQPSKYIEEDTQNFTEDNTENAPNAVQSRDQVSKHIEDNTQNLTDHDTGDAPNAVQCRDNLEPVPDSIVDQNVTEDNVSGVKQRFGGPIAMALNRRLVIEPFSAGSYSSPRSVLPEDILEDQIPISDVEQHIQTDLPRSVIKDLARDNLANNQTQENVIVNMPLIVQQLVENSVGHSSSNCSLGTLEGSSNMTENSTNNSTVQNTNEPVLEDKHGKEDSSIKSSIGKSTSMNLEDAEELSKSSRESNASYIDHLEGGPQNLIEYEPGIDASKLEEKNSKSDDPGTMTREEEPTNPLKEVPEEGNIVGSINNSVLNEKEAVEKLTTDQGESQFSIRPEDIRGPEESNEHDADVNKTEANESNNTSIPETAREGKKPTAEVDHICNMNDSLADNVTNKEILNDVPDAEIEPQILSRQQGDIEPSKAYGVTTAGLNMNPKAKD